MSAPEPDDDDTEVKFRLTYDEWEKLVDAIKHVDRFGGGKLASMRYWLVKSPVAQLDQLANSLLFLAKFVKEKITEV